MRPHQAQSSPIPTITEQRLLSMKHAIDYRSAYAALRECHSNRLNEGFAASYEAHSKGAAQLLMALKLAGASQPNPAEIMQDGSVIVWFWTPNKVSTTYRIVDPETALMLGLLKLVGGVSINSCGCKKGTFYPRVSVNGCQCYLSRLIAGTPKRLMTVEAPDHHDMRASKIDRLKSDARSQQEAGIGRVEFLAAIAKGGVRMCKRFTDDELKSISQMVRDCFTWLDERPDNNLRAALAA